MKRWLWLSVVLAAVAHGANDGCRLEPLPLERVDRKAQSEYEGSVGDYVLRFPNDAPKGERNLADGFSIEHRVGGRRCHADTGIVQEVYRSRDGKRVFVVGFSGSTTHLDYVAVPDCRVLLHREEYTRKVEVDGTVVRVFPGCEAIDGAGKHQCEPGSVFRMDDACGLVRDRAASRKLTRDDVGVAFDRSTTVQNPSKPGAKIVPR